VRVDDSEGGINGLLEDRDGAEVDCIWLFGLEFLVLIELTGDVSVDRLDVIFEEKRRTLLVPAQTTVFVHQLIVHMNNCCHHRPFQHLHV